MTADELLELERYLTPAERAEQVANAVSHQSRILTQPAASSKARELWSSMPNDEKIDHLNGLLNRAMREALPGLLSSGASAQ